MSVYYHTNFMVYSREQMNAKLENLCQPGVVRVCAPRGLAREALGSWILSSGVSLMFLSVVTLRFRRWHPFLVSLLCFEGLPPEAVSLCEVLRCMRGIYGRRVFVVCYLMVLGLLFWPFSGSGDLLLLGMGVSPSGRVRGVWGLGGVFGVLGLVREGWYGQVSRCSSLEVSSEQGGACSLIGWSFVAFSLGGWRPGGGFCCVSVDVRGAFAQSLSCVYCEL
jgi:hypothetical protein